MAKEKISFEQFLDVLDESHHAFVLDLHKYLTDNGYKVSFEEKKTGLSGSYTKSRKSVGAVALKKQGLTFRINGANTSKYPDFLNALPAQMVQSIEKAPVCKGLVSGNNCAWEEVIVTAA